MRAQPKVTKVGLGMGAFGLVMVVFGLGQLAWSSRQALASDLAVVEPPAELGVILVDVSGAVIQPGVYQLQAGDRWSQAVKQAGGMLPQANVLFVSKQLNLAQPAKDGDKIYIPFADEMVIPSTGVSTSEVVGIPTTTATPTGPGISINTASAKELQSLSGIGAARAEAIIENRPYANINELVEGKVIPQSVFDQIKSSINL